MTAANKSDDAASKLAGSSSRPFYRAPIDDAAKLCIHSQIKKSLPRFEALFHRFWDRLADKPKEVMVQHWLTPEHLMADNGPEIFLLYKWAGRAIACPATTQAIRETGEFRVLFHRGSFESMPDDIAVILIAHEFAHVYQRATGTLYSHPPLSRDEAIRIFEQEVGEPYAESKKWLRPAVLESAIEEVMYGNSPVEIEAHKIAKSWEFDIDALDAWSREWASQFN